MKIKTNKPIYNEYIKIRCTTEDKQSIMNRADQLGMPLSTYSRDMLINGKDRTLYGKRKVCTTIVQITDLIDNLHGLLQDINVTPEQKNQIAECMEQIHKEREKLWNC